MKRLSPLIALWVLVLTGFTPSVIAGTYFEYAPDAWQSYRHAVSTAGTPYQFFQSATDFELTGFSFWIDNTGSSGNVTFTLLDDQNTTLAEKTVTLGQAPAVAGGSRLRIELDTPISISHYRTYSIQISSTLIGFGLYYSNRINILEHNLNYTTEYAMGVAQLGSEKQNFTFKLSLEDPTEDGEDGEQEAVIENSTSTEEEEEAPAGPIATVVTNARITNITGTTAVAAWTTNVAADSSVTVRRQISPLYVYTSAYDDTLELEHALTITGLTPHTNYFADFFSRQDEDEALLTTYTVSFTTSDLTEEEEAQQQQQEEEDEQASSTPQTGATEDELSTSTPAETEDEDDALPSATIGQGTGADSFSINWQTPAGGTPNGGYRIDIFDEQNRLIRQLRAPGDATSRNVAILPAGQHTAIVYADRDGVYEKVAAPTVFEAKKARSPLFWFWYLIAVILALVIAFAFLFSRREKTELPKLD